jgi:hypothetical protein
MKDTVSVCPPPEVMIRELPFDVHDPLFNGAKANRFSQLRFADVLYVVE